MPNKVFIKANALYEAPNKRVQNDIEMTGAAAKSGGRITTFTSRPYNVYTAAIKQTGTSAPVPVVLENTINASSWVRNSVGIYQFGCDTFQLAKVHMGGFGDYWGSASSYLPLTDGYALVGYYGMYPDVDNFSAFVFQCLNASFEATDLSDIIGATTIFLPDIRIYL